MKSYEEIKNIIAENKQRLVLMVCFLLVFVIGFGTGRFARETTLPRTKVQNNYNTKSTSKPVQNQPDSATSAKASLQASSLPDSCPVKGNISSAGKKIYHIPGGAFYKTVKPEQCFASEGEAQAAGFVKSSR